ncbi:MAG TPA: hypothetical protein VMD07_00210, partial [Candidatus Acidoferrales bacterium]|nr:hypothetical protein [Candidatus Acidoferrales bacterium]
MPADRILRVGGQEADNRTLEALLKAAGMNDVKFATSGDALPLITGHQCDIVVLDLMQSSGEVLKLLRAASPSEDGGARVPVVVTAPPTATDRIQSCLQYGAEDFILTPVDSKAPLLVTRRIALALQRRRMADFKIKVNAPAQEPDETAVLKFDDAFLR